MNPEYWKPIQKLFEQALALDSGEREAFLIKTCGNNPQVLALLRSLLDAYDSLETFEYKLIGGAPATDTDD